MAALRENISSKVIEERHFGLAVQTVKEQLGSKELERQLELDMIAEFEDKISK